MLRAFLGILFLLLTGILLFASIQPDDFRVTRQIRIHAAPEEAYTLVNNLRRWSDWSPWEKLDPAMKRTYSLKEEGVGAVYGWSGNGEVGAGSMQIVEATSPRSILFKLDFTSPMKAHNMTLFNFQSQGEFTDVTWTMYGPYTYVGKVMSIFLTMDDMVGKDFEKGLSNLKQMAEK